MIFVGVLFFIIILVAIIITSKRNLTKKNAKMKTNWVQVGMLIQKRFDLVSRFFGDSDLEQCEAVKRILEAKNIYSFASDVSARVGIVNGVEKYFKEIENLDKLYPENASDEKLIKTKEEMIKLNKDIVFAKLCYNQAVIDFNKQSEKGINKKMTEMLHLELGSQLV